MKHFIRIAVAALFATTTLSLAACNTIEGVGQDIESAGKAIERTGQNR